MDIVVTSNFETPCEVALSYDKVVSARSLNSDGKTLIAILTAPIYLKSERDTLLNDIAASAKETFGNDCIVTVDTEIFRKIKPDMSENAKRALLEKAEARSNLK